MERRNEQAQESQGDGKTDQGSGASRRTWPWPGIYRAKQQQFA
jgi:hypothetical protein